MKLWSLLYAALIGLGTYLLLELFFGSYGLVAYRLMTEHVTIARTELTALEDRHEELSRQVRLLTAEAETIRLEARDSGLVAENEYVVRIDGREPRPRHRYLPGSLPPAVPETRDNRPLFRSIGLAVALVYILVDALASQPSLSFVPRRRRDHRWDVEVEGDEFPV